MAFRAANYWFNRAFLANGATQPRLVKVGFSSREPIPGASNPIVPLLTPPRQLRVSGMPGYGDLVGVGATPLLSWDAPTSAPAGLAMSYGVALYRLGVNASTGRTTVNLVAQANGISGTSVQFPGLVLVSGGQYFATVTVSAGDGAQAFTAASITGTFSP
jgi:hypothetical protein